jgi:hypothetical protein
LRPLAKGSKKMNQPLVKRATALTVAVLTAGGTLTIPQATRPAFAAGLQGTYSGTITGITGVCRSNRTGEQINGVQVGADGTLTYSFPKVLGAQSIPVKGTVAPNGKIQGNGDGVAVGGNIDPLSGRGQMTIFTGSQCTWNVDLHR